MSARRIAPRLLLPPREGLPATVAAIRRASADSVIRLLKELSADGITVLVSAHDEHLIAAADSTTKLA